MNSGSLKKLLFASPILLVALNASLNSRSQESPATASPSQSGKTSASDEGSTLFLKEVRPILQQKCWPCHSGAAPMADLDLTTRASLLKGSDSGPVVPTDGTETGALLDAIHYKGKQMPPTGKLPQKQIDALARWVKLGMPWPDTAAPATAAPSRIVPPEVTPEAKRFWSFRPVKRPPVPTVRNRAWVRNPVDAFVLKGLEDEKLSPAPPASKAALLRRATYDLTGLPPTPAEIAAFVSDRSPKAYEKVIDRLLASPRYGEKWGRHWLDLVRFAETNSYERDGEKPNAWRYRDYVIRSFNADKPYNQFIKEQLAGDEIAPGDADSLIATGFYRLGIWDDEPADPEQALYDDLDDVVSTTGQVFLGLTINCARCHNHKLDPIPQKDYYSFLAFFNGVKRYGGEDLKDCERPLASPAEQKRYATEIAAHKAKVEALSKRIEAVHKRVEDDLSPREKEEFQKPEARLALLQKRAPKIFSQAELDDYVARVKERSDLESHPPKSLQMALAVVEEGKTARDTFVLMRGNAHAPGDRVEPAFPEVLSPPRPVIVPPADGESSGRRRTLADWIASPANPLTARVMANRIWQFHFGRGIVRSTSNFGYQGDKPTHPELLDWLASELAKNGWRMKPIHRMLMLSNTYRMSSQSNPKALAKDPENDHFWRFDMRRLTAEEVRDSILAVDGGLNPKMGGPGIFPTLPAEVLAGQSRPGDGWTPSSKSEQRRRSVYVFAKRSLMLPILANFDAPEPDFTCPVRFSTVQPTQALGMVNSDFVNGEAHAFADDLLKRAKKTSSDRVRLALLRVLQRNPTPAEVARGVKLIATIRREEGKSEREALAAFCIVALNLNEFLYLE